MSLIHGMAPPIWSISSFPMLLLQYLVKAFSNSNLTILLHDSKRHQFMFWTVFGTYLHKSFEKYADARSKKWLEFGIEHTYC